LAWDGHAMIYENGRELAASQRFARQAQLICADIDLERLRNEHMRLSSFRDAQRLHQHALAPFRTVPFRLDLPHKYFSLERGIERFPYVPANAASRDERCFEAYNIQVAGLIQRLQSSGLQKIVIGISGGLDSTQALIVAARAMDQLQWP